jgi:hypothetical protein
MVAIAHPSQVMPSWNSLPLLTLEDVARPRPAMPHTLVLLENNNLARRRDNMAALFIPSEHVSSFWSMMRLTKSVVSGSTTLLFWLGLDFFKPGDLDIFTPLSNADSVCAWFREVLGWNHVSETKEKYKEGGTMASGVEKVVRMGNGDVWVDITISRGVSALLPIVNFWSTVLRNCVTADGAYCAYPGQLLTPRGFIPALPQYRTTGSTDHLVQKYERRSMDNVHSVGEWTGIEGNGCSDRWTCPAEWRWFGDDGGALCWFREGYTMAENRNLMMCDIPVVWRLSGGECRSHDFGDEAKASCSNIKGFQEPKSFELSTCLKGEAEHWQMLDGDHGLGWLQNGSLDVFFT